MNKKKKIFAVACGTIFLSGCATMGQSAGLTTLACAGTGILVGALTHSAGWGAGAGGICAAVGLIAVYSYHSSQTRTAQQDQQVYGYTTPTNSTAVKIRNAISSPERVRVGDTVRVATDYSVMAPQGSRDVQVKEHLVLKKDGQSLKELNDRPIQRAIGGHLAEVEFQIPAKMPAGTYVIEHRVQSGTSYDVRQSVFVVQS